MKGCEVKLLSWKDDHGYGLHIRPSFPSKNIKLDNSTMRYLNSIKHL